MASFSVSAAVGAGFQLIGRKPLSVFVWGLFAVVVGVLPVLGVMGTSMGPMFDLMRETQLHPQTSPDPTAFTHVYSHMMFVNPLLQLLSMVVRTMLAAAVFRAVLEPKNSGFAYLRIGMQEIWILLVTLVEIILFMIGFVFVVLVAVAIGAILHQTLATSVAIIASVVLGLAVFVGSIWVLLRLSMALPMSFEDRQFRLFESWAFTRGHAGDLFLLALLMFVILIVMEIMVLGVLAIPAMIFIAPHMTTPDAMPTAMAALLKQSPQALLQSAGLAIVVFAIVGSCLIGALHAIFIAPWAAAYRMMKPAAEPA